jgi:hypothetical protein
MGHAAEALEEQMRNRELGILRDKLKILEETGRVSDLVTINRFVDSLLAHQPSAQQPDAPRHQDRQSSA